MLPTSEQRAATVDTGALYEELRQELIGVVRAASAEELDRMVTATPEWRVRDVLAHVTGIAHDLNRQDLGGADPDAWTAAQVDRHRDDTVEAVIAVWDVEAPAFEDGLHLFGYPVGSHFVGDLHAHLQDVRHALGHPPHDADRTVLVALDFYLESLDTALRDEGAGTLTVEIGAEVHVAGTGGPEATLGGPAFEVLRALSGRRSLLQIRAMTWSGAADDLAPMLSRYPLPEVDVGA